MVYLDMGPYPYLYGGAGGPLHASRRVPGDQEMNYNYNGVSGQSAFLRQSAHYLRIAPTQYRPGSVTLSGTLPS